MNYLSMADLNFPMRKSESRKGDNGKLLIIGGSEKYVGALALAGLAALRAGADVVTIAAPKQVAWAINCLTPDLITEKTDCKYFQLKHATKIINLANKYDAVLIGNGIGTQSDPFIKKVVSNINVPTVIDADAIKALSIKPIKNCLLTPHKKELDILLNNSKINKSDVKGLQKSVKTNVLLIKGKVDKIISKTQTAYNATGNEGLTKAGTGDVLAGLAAGFLCQGLTLFDSACNAAFINGELGDILKKKKGYAFIASDLVEDISKIIKR